VRRSLVLLALLAAPAAAQTAPPDLARERTAFTNWLTRSPRSPFAATALERDADGRPVVRYGPLRNVHPPAWYPFDSGAVLVGTLRPPAGAAPRRVLTLDGIEVEATDAGWLEATLRGTAIRLAVLRIPDQWSDEAELTIYFRDATSDRGTYPAGRFVVLDPLGGGRYRVDFNRARNPFCAYSTVYPCPVPWPGNTLEIAVEAGERYVPPTPVPARPGTP
jgi:uncharacterized protein (DUF1684 family)